jgi:phenylpyruvate tautomerase PptA (4-oxalocrotonate tautomerase family)
MPLYLCSTPASTLDDGGRRRVAEAITGIHCELTGAPPTVVHVVFDESADGACSVVGTIRAGRSDEIKAELRDRIARAVAAAVDVEAAAVGVVTTDVPASWVMEGGAVMPEPGDEARWLAAHRSGGPAR